eukprot:TRINITY_DN2049_c1_g1_i3.p1 TRINITY_DN2049_c1_g1~~TRINITY_DN2049_c1_g1_i3.p1  ORF type:complete len:259 (-),score=47.20 TRINITY_DN2049_c1_g1_i3:268-1044(-)
MSTTSSSSSSSSSSSRTSNHDTPLPRLDHCRAPASYFLDHPTTTTTTITTTSTSSSLSASPKTASAAEPGTAPTSTLSDIPSISSGVRTLAEEKERRRECIGRIHETCVRLQVPQQVTSTACVLFHRLYIRQCLPGEVGSTMLNEISCVYLSTKLEEHPRLLATSRCGCGAGAESVTRALVRPARRTPAQTLVELCEVIASEFHPHPSGALSPRRHLLLLAPDHCPPSRTGLCLYRIRLEIGWGGRSNVCGRALVGRV